jgi:hypothetical protein
MTEEDKISRRYRELPREEPPRHLDEAILAASSRAVHTHPAPLVVPSGRQRWYFPLAAAAIIVLAVGVTLHMQLQQPAEEMASADSVAAPPSVRGFELRDQALNEQRPKKPAASSTEPQPRLDLRPPAELQKAQEAVASSPPPASVSQDALIAQGAVMGRVEARRRADTEAVAPAPQAAPLPQAALRRAEEGARKAPMLSAAALQSPEQWLQGIADLRWQGYHDEADRQLAEFRKRYPDYRIPEAMLRKVERPR